ncbi:FomA family porin-like outer membrane protein [Mesopusillimonas faecipullorum]
MKNHSKLLGLALLMAGAAQATEFQPSGNLGLTQTFYGNSGSYKTATAHPSLVFNYQFAPKWSIDIEWDRTWNLHSYNGGRKQQNNDFSQPDATLNYSYGTLGDSKVDWSSSLKIETQSNFNNNSQAYVMAQTVFDFSRYLPSNDYLKSTQFALAPMYVYGKNISGPSGKVHTAGLGLLTNWTLPANFSLTVNAYVFKDWYNGTFVISNNNTNYKNATYFMLSAWLEYSKILHQFNAKTSLAFNFSGGFDPYIMSNRRASWDPFLAGNDMNQWLSPTVMEGNYKRTYDLFATPQLSLTYNVNKNFSINAFVQVKYSNQVWGQTEKDWRFQPQGGFGLSYGF